MNTSKYGNAQFEHKTNFGSIVVFSDEENTHTFQEQMPKSDNRYVHIFQDQDANQWIAKTSDMLIGEYGDFMIYTQNLSPVGSVQANQLTFFLEEGQEQQYGDVIMDYYQMDGKLYLQVNAAIALQEVVISATNPSNRKKTIPEPKLDGFVTVFVSSDGAKLEQAYQKINDVKERELVIFAEKDDATNLFGSVFRVHSGRRLSSNSIYPKRELSSVLRSYAISDLATFDVDSLISQHFKGKDEDSFFLWLPRQSTSFIKLAADLSFNPLGDFMETIAKGMQDNLKLGDNRWKATIEGEVNGAYKPILHTPDVLEKGNSTMEAWGEKIYEAHIQELANPIKRLINELNGNVATKRFLGNRLNGLLLFVEQIPNYLSQVVGGIFKYVKKAVEFYNALLVGIINSLVDLLKSVFDILGLVFKGVYALTAVAEKTAQNPGTVFGIVFESFENVISVVASAFTLRNLKVFFGFQSYIVEAVGKLGIVVAQKAMQFLQDEDKAISIPFDAIGYYSGYVVGFIAQEIAIFMATAGVGTIAEGIKGTMRSYVALKNAIVGTTKATAKGTRRAITVSIDTFLRGVQYLKRFFKNLPKHLDTLKLWMDELIARLKVKLGYLSKTSQDFVDEFGLVIKKTDKGMVLGANPVVNKLSGDLYGVFHKDAKIFEGTEKEVNIFIEEVAKKTDGQKYLDELAELTRKRTKVFVENISDIGSQNNKTTLKLIDSSGNEIGNLTRTISDKGRRVIYMLNNKEIESYVMLLNQNLGKTFELPVKHGENLIFVDFNIPKGVTDEVSGLGKIMLDDALIFFKGNKKFPSVDGTLDLYMKSSTYSDYGGQSIILNQFWKAMVRNGGDIDEAAFSTFAGEWARNNGFKRIWYDSVNHPLTEEEVMIKFLKE